MPKAANADGGGEGKMRLALAALFLFSISLPTAAQIKGCYDRTYSDAHMKAHPGQKVTRMRLQIGLETGPDSNEADLNGMDIWLRGEKKRRYAIPICRQGKPPLDCGMEADGGSFTLEETKDGVKLVNRNYLRADDPDGDEEDGVELPNDKEHTIFLLPLVSTGRCPP